jgi:hypothetical protein
VVAVADNQGNGSDGTDSVLDHLGTISWSADDGVAYEVALESINQVIGAYSCLIGRENSATTPDLEAIAGWRREQQRWSARRRQLSPADPDEVAAVRRECAALLVQLTGHR